MLLGLFLLSRALAPGPTPALAATSFAELKSTIQARDIRTLEELLPYLPADYLSHYTLVHAGQGIQEASPANPRAILFGDTSQTVLSFNGSPEQDGFNELELEEFDISQSRFVYHAIRFDETGREPPAFSGANPTRCLGCHGQNPKPIFPEYPNWTGFYGSAHDALTGAEVADFANFMRNQPQHPRYRYLSREFLWPGDGTEPGLALHMPNNYYGKLIARWNSRRLGDEILTNPSFSSLGHGFLLLTACGLDDDANPPANFLFDGRLARIRAAMANRIQRLIRDKYPPDTHAWLAALLSEAEHVVDSTGQALGFLSPETFTFNFPLRAAANPATGVQIPGQDWFDGLDSISTLVNKRVLAGLAVREPDLRRRLRVDRYISFATRRGFLERYGDGSATTFDEIVPRTYLSRWPFQGCDWVADRAERELGLR